MSGDGSLLSERADELRRSFDSAFAAPLKDAARETVDCIGIRLGDERYAVRLSQIGGLHTDIRITPCPSTAPALVGIAGIRGTLAAVYDLAAMLGYAPSPARWLVLANGADLALAFTAFEEHLSFEPAAIAGSGGAQSRPYIAEIAQRRGQVWPIVDIDALVATIRKQLPSTIISGE